MQDAPRKGRFVLTDALAGGRPHCGAFAAFVPDHDSCESDDKADGGKIPGRELQRHKIVIRKFFFKALFPYHLILTVSFFGASLRAIEHSRDNSGNIFPVFLVFFSKLGFQSHFPMK
jgi:hypothetical protein